MNVQWHQLPISSLRLAAERCPRNTWPVIQVYWNHHNRWFTSTSSSSSPSSSSTSSSSSSPSSSSTSSTSSSSSPSSSTSSSSSSSSSSSPSSSSSSSSSPSSSFLHYTPIKVYHYIIVGLHPSNCSCLRCYGYRNGTLFSSPLSLCRHALSTEGWSPNPPSK